MNTICLGFLIIFACRPPMAAASPTLAFCDGYRPVRMSHRDTRPTKEQVNANNRVWTAFCQPR